MTQVRKTKSNSNYPMLKNVSSLLQPLGDGGFMHLTKEYSPISYSKFDSMLKYFTHEKLLDKRIHATRVILDDDKRTLLWFGVAFT